MTRLTLVRHGETEGQSSIRYYGRTDVPLSALGRAQMERARAALRAHRFDAIYASRLSRSVEAAAIIGGLPPGQVAGITRVAGFNEIHFGEWEGLTADEIRMRDAERYERWISSRGDFQYPGGESVAAFRQRVVRALHEVLAQAPPGHLLFVVHKGIIRSALSELLQLDEQQGRALTVSLASIHVIGRSNRGWQAEVLDRTDHL